MGQWGLETCSGDSCWDCLEAKDIHRMTQIECNRTIKNHWKNKETRLYSKDEFDYDKLGVVVWILSKGKRVDIDKLKECLVIADRMMTKKVMDEQGWGEDNGRKEAVLKEIEMIKSAIKNKGKGKKRYIAGLFDKMADFVEGE